MARQLVLLSTAALLLVAGAFLAQAAPAPAATTATTAVRPADVASLTIQFDNRAKSLGGRNEQKILEALADNVFLVPVSQVKAVSTLDQSTLGGVLGSQAVAVYRATGPSRNGRTVYQNCQTNTKGGLFSSSPAYKAIKKVTDTWWPGDSVKIQSAKCTQA